jgi:hypothetical protein
MLQAALADEHSAAHILADLMIAQTGLGTPQEDLLALATRPSDR